MITEYQVVPLTVNGSPRFVIISVSGELLDDAQGYGYKTRQNAEKAAWYKFKGGKEKKEATKRNAMIFWKKHPDIKQFATDYIEGSFKECDKGTPMRCTTAIKKEFDVVVDEKFLDFL